jgi:hypothetical protein
MRNDSLSVSFPRVSPNGQFLMYTVSRYGNFSIWHKDADLRLIDLIKNRTIDLTNVNSKLAESYHSWSSDSKWFVFSSRRVDGLYTRPFFAHLESDGVTTKPFMLPQKDPDFYDLFLKSYNIPEFITGPVTVSHSAIEKIARYDKGKDVKFVESGQ